jgi:hypothetical protein
MFLILSVLLSMGDVPMAAKNENHAMELEVSKSGSDKISVTLKGNSPVDQRVSYELNTRGSSTSVHRGKTSLNANSPVVLSTISFSAGNDWCVTLNVDEEAGPSYQIVEGDGCS